MRDEEVPKHFKKVKKKPYGIRFGCHYTRWYETEKARNQAFIDLPKHTCNVIKDHGHTWDYQKVER
jgi:hypothetical protein